MNEAFETAVETLIEAIKADYRDYTLRCAANNTFNREVDHEGLSQINHDMIAAFDAKISYTVGKKYAKIITDGSVWGFVVAVDNDKKFPKGTILKPAGWATPARNHGRGNIIEGGYSIRWTGPNYMY